VERGETSVSAALVPALLKIAQRATAVEPDERHPSADEFAVALRRVANIERPAEEQLDATAMWPIVGIETTASRLVQAVWALQSGDALCLRGRVGSGRSVLLRRLAWSLGVEGDQLVWVDDFMVDNAEAIGAEVQSAGRLDTLFIVVDDADQLDPAARDVIRTARSGGARIVSVGTESFGATAQSFEVPPLIEQSSLELLKRAIPSLTDRMAKRIHGSAMGLPGELKRFVALLAKKPVVSDEDVDQLLFGADTPSNSVPASDPLTHALALLARGRYDEAKSALELVRVADPLVLAVTRARLSVGLGDGRKALAELQAVKEQAAEREGTREAMAWKVWLGRAHISLAEYSVALELLASKSRAERAMRVSRAWLGLVWVWFCNAGTTWLVPRSLTVKP
jgi:serine/threonine-protein kinase PknK